MHPGQLLYFRILLFQKIRIRSVFRESFHDALPQQTEEGKTLLEKRHSDHIRKQCVHIENLRKQVLDFLRIFFQVLSFPTFLNEVNHCIHSVVTFLAAYMVRGRIGFLVIVIIRFIHIFKMLATKHGQRSKTVIFVENMLRKPKAVINKNLSAIDFRYHAARVKQ